jgi:hypothetical protein
MSCEMLRIGIPQRDGEARHRTTSHLGRFLPLETCGDNGLDSNETDSDPRLRSALH